MTEQYSAQPERPEQQEQQEQQGQPEQSGRKRVIAYCVLAVSVLLVLAAATALILTNHNGAEYVQLDTHDISREATGAATAAPDLLVDATESDYEEDATSAESDSEESEDDNASSSRSRSVAASTEDNAGSGSQRAATSGSSGNSGSGSGSSSGSSGSSGSSSTSSNQSSSQGNSGGSGQAPSGSTAQNNAPRTITVSIEIDARTAHASDPAALPGTFSSGVLLSRRNVTVPEGATVRQALDATGVRVNARGAYIVGLGGLSEFDFGPRSGWMFSVNGSFPNSSAANTTLSAGDTIAWRYTLNRGADIGAP